jgi:adenosylhomocysteine nucleosidase
MIKLGIVCGLAFEAAIIDRAVQETNPAQILAVACSGPGADRAREAAQRLAAQGAEALLSFGIAGGLDPALRTGTAVVASRLIGNNELSCDGPWATRLFDGLANQFEVKRGHLAEARDVLATPESKASMFRTNGAAAADMESYGIAEIATERNMPFAALRVICDLAEETIPPMAVAAMTDDGRVRTATTAIQALLHPAQIPDLMRLGRRTAQARDVLEKLARFGVPRLFCASR